MRISTKGRYSLEALLYMALLSEGEFASTKVIAENTDLSDGYLEQLFIPLRRAGIVQGIRGPQGGYLLGKPPSQIRVGDVLRVVEGPLEPVECLRLNTCPAQNDCLSRHTWNDLYKAIVDCVDSVTLKDLTDAFHSIGRSDYTI